MKYNSIDSVLDYLNYSMILNKYELRKHLNQQRNIIFTHHNYNSYNTNNNNNPSSNQHHQMAASCNSNTKLSIIRSKLSSNPTTAYQHQLSSGYNSENHSNSSQCTTATAAHNHLACSGYRGTHNNDEYLALFNFYRLTLNHLPSNFSNTLCTCNATTSIKN